MSPTQQEGFFLLLRFFFQRTGIAEPPYENPRRQHFNHAVQAKTHERHAAGPPSGCEGDDRFQRVVADQRVLEAERLPPQCVRGMHGMEE